jgi:hypothetical protein
MLKNILILSFFICINIQSICALEVSKQREDENIFKSHDDGAWIKYSKLEQMGCTTKLSFRANQLRISSDIKCYRINGKMENIGEMAKSVSEIINYFKLEDRIKSLKTVAFVLNRGHLLRAINNDESWPKNIQSYVKALLSKNSF